MRTSPLYFSFWLNDCLRLTEIHIKRFKKQSKDLRTLHPRSHFPDAAKLSEVVQVSDYVECLGEPRPAHSCIYPRTGGNLEMNARNPSECLANINLLFVGAEKWGRKCCGRDATGKWLMRESRVSAS